ncbi:hypothetical protein [Roseibium sp.]|uniref:hypothetical protein n=1 Tax=Roseibium sp. TaxID=1936156 RepID=UPI003D0A61FD
MIRKGISAAFGLLVFLSVSGNSAAVAEEAVSEEAATAVTDGAPDRYSLVAADGDVLRIDRQNGTVSICKQKNEAWRCNPVPLAEEAYLAEINALAGEVEKLTARVEELEGGNADSQSQLPPGSALDRPDTDASPGDQTSGLTSEDEEELDRVLDFTETAMRRFFGMVRELQQDLDGSGN